jgi:hypothetical protein
MAFARAIGHVMSTLILTVFWVLVIGPYALVWKLILKNDGPKDSYWVDTSNTKHNYSRQF